MEIPLTRLYNYLNKELQDIFEYRPGMDGDAPPPLTTVAEQELSIDTPCAIGIKSSAG